MNRCEFAGMLMQVAWEAMGLRCKMTRRDPVALREAFDWNTLTREVLFSPDSVMRFRNQKIWQLRIQALIGEAEAKVPAVAAQPSAIAPTGGVVTEDSAQTINGHEPAEAAQ